MFWALPHNGVEGVENVEKADTRQPKPTNEKWPRKAIRLKKVQKGDGFRSSFLAMRLRSSTVPKELADTSACADASLGGLMKGKYGI